MSRLPLARIVFTIINKYDLEVCQLDVKTAFLNRKIDGEIYMEILQGASFSDKDKNENVCKIEHSL